MKTINEQLQEIVKSENVGVGLADKFHDIRRDVLMELEVLFDRVDDGYVKDDYTKLMLIEGVREMDYVLRLLKLIKTRL
jgi:hypothetical protein